MMIMTYYEIKKVFSKKGSKVALIFIFIVISVVLSFIIGDNKYVNRNGDAESGISAMLKVRELKKEWSGELTEDVLRKIIEENVRISQTPEAKSNDFRQNDIAYSQRQGLSFKDSEEEMIESVLAALKTGRNIYCDEKNINPLKIHYGDIVILLATRELFRKQKKVDLSFTEFEILHLLMRSPGRVFSKEQIYDIIWNEPYSGDYNVVMRHICNIREKIEDDPGHPVYIQTVRGVGYRFNGNLGSE